MLKILYMKWSLFLSFAIDDLTAKYSLKAKIQKILIGLTYTFSSLNLSPLWTLHFFSSRYKYSSQTWITQGYVATLVCSFYIHFMSVQVKVASTKKCVYAVLLFNMHIDIHSDRKVCRLARVT